MLNKYGIPYEAYTHETLTSLIAKIKELSRVFNSAETIKDIELLQDDMAGVMLRKQNAESKVITLEKQKDEINNQITELEQEIESDYDY